MPDTLTNMRAFLLTVESGSLSKAADTLNVSHSVITKRINQLEWSLHAKLLARTTRSIALTETGERYLPFIRRIVRDHDQLSSGVILKSAGLEGTLRVSCPASKFGIQFQRIFARFQSLHPAIVLEAIFADRIESPLDSGVDIAFTVNNNFFEGTVERLFVRLERVLCCSPEYAERCGIPLQPQDLQHHVCLVSQPYGTEWTFRGPSGPLTVTVTGRLVTNNSEMLRTAVLEGNGITIISRAVVDAQLAAGQLIPLLRDYDLPESWVKAVIPESRVGLARVEALLALVDQETQLSPFPVTYD